MKKETVLKKMCERLEYLKSRRAELFHVPEKNREYLKTHARLKALAKQIAHIEYGPDFGPDLPVVASADVPAEAYGKDNYMYVRYESLPADVQKHVHQCRWTSKYFTECGGLRRYGKNLRDVVTEIIRRGES